MSSPLRALLPIALVALPALAFVLWPLRRLGERSAIAAPAGDRRLELAEERRSVLRALRELDFDHEAGHIADDDYQTLRERYEARAAGVLVALDALGPAPAPAPAPAAARPRGWARSPLALATGAVVLLAFGVALGVSVGRFTEPDQTVTPPGARVPVPGPATSGEAAPLAPAMLAGMLQAARQALVDGQYPQAIAAYQAVLKREPRNVDALTHLALIVALGGHKDEALRTLDRAIAIDASYPPAHLYRGQVLYDQQDYAGAIAAWERFVALAPASADRDRVTEMVREARARQTSGRTPTRN
jgi:tetratricopeptide (TPR) repeat protein